MFILNAALLPMILIAASMHIASISSYRHVRTEANARAQSTYVLTHEDILCVYTYIYIYVCMYIYTYVDVYVFIRGYFFIYALFLRIVVC